VQADRHREGEREKGGEGGREREERGRGEREGEGGRGRERENGRQKEGDSERGRERRIDSAAQRRKAVLHAKVLVAPSHSHSSGHAYGALKRM
jgi:hypothetical protein